MNVETFSTILTLDHTHFEAHLRFANNTTLPPFNALTPPSFNSPDIVKDSEERKKSKGGNLSKLLHASKSFKSSSQWDLHIRNTYFPTHVFHLKVGKEQFKLITKDYGPQLKQKKLYSIVRQALDPEYNRASFGYFFADGDVEVQLGDDIVEKLRGKSRRKPLSTKDSLIIKIMFDSNEEYTKNGVAPISNSDLVFWLVLQQRRGTAPFDNYNLIRGLEKELNIYRSENIEMKHYLNQFHSELARMKMEMKLLRENVGQHRPNSGTWQSRKLVYLNSRNTSGITSHRSRLSQVVLSALNQFESSVLGIPSSMNGEIPYSQKVAFVISLAKGLLNCDVDFDLVVQFKESLLEQIESSNTIDSAKEIVFTHLTDLLNPVKVSCMNMSFNSSFDQDSYNKIGKRMEFHLNNIYNPTFDSCTFGGDMNKPMFIMLVGLKNSGKTTVALQLAFYYKKLGLRPAILQSDTYSLAYLKIQAENELIPFYGSDTKIDCYDIIRDGIPCLLEYDIIIIDTPGFENMNSLFSTSNSILETVSEASKEYLNRIAKEKLEVDSSENMEQESIDKMTDGSDDEEIITKPNMLPDKCHTVSEVIAIVDSSIGNEAGLLISSYKGSMPLHTAITTNTAHPHSMGALSAIASTGTPIAFISYSDKLEDFEKYDVNHAFTDLLDIHTIDDSKYTFTSVNQNLQTSLEPEEIPFTLASFRNIIQNDINLQNQGVGHIWMKILNTFNEHELCGMYVSAMPRIEQLKEIARRSECTVEEVRLLFSCYLEYYNDRTKRLE